ncbi:hypothetical protein IEQ34_018824 [Dendrobium chrysotoxum]|uniref:Uncharacterized protein n=1 Tax=Dendrobium chrysotoxum TaxID=161865 RepID=A0AAV7G5X1_DENCH|nr:hypothetical protein IEQ34_018824 [Dendrobium chrysotoxum]
MHEIDVIFDDGDVATKRVSPGLRVSPGEAKDSAATNHRHFPHRMKGLVSAKHGEHASVILTGREG